MVLMDLKKSHLTRRTVWARWVSSISV